MSVAIDGMIDNPALLWFWGIINLLFGAAIVALHGNWSSDLRVIITVAGWAGVAKGVFLMLFPNSAIELYRTSNRASVLTIGGILAMSLGLFLLFSGFGGYWP